MTSKNNTFKEPTLERDEKNFRIYQYQAIRGDITNNPMPQSGYVILKGWDLYKEVLGALVYLGFQVFEFEEELGEKVYRISYSISNENEQGKLYFVGKEGMLIEKFSQEPEEFFVYCNAMFYKEIETIRPAFLYRKNYSSRQREVLSEIVLDKNNKKKGYRMIVGYEIFPDIMEELQKNGLIFQEFTEEHGDTVYRMSFTGEIK